MSAPELAQAPTAGRVRAPVSGGLRALSPQLVAAAVVAVLTAIGLVLRALYANQPISGDELSTYWIVATHGLGGVLALLYGSYHGIQHAEITPPLYFVLSWLTAQLGHAPELLRLPSLIAGTLTIPVVYLLGLRTVGRAPALIASALTTFSPFMIYYSAEARAYGVMMLLSTLSTLSMLYAVDTRRTRWWVAYAVCFCLAFYTHFTCVFVLLGQLLWLLWAHPRMWRPALLANVGAAVGLAPWTHGFIQDLNSPTTKILSALSPFTAQDVRLSLEHWSLGYPYVQLGGLTKLPGVPALILLALSTFVTVVGLIRRVADLGVARALRRIDKRVWLVLVLAVSVPIGEALVSAVSTHLFGVRNLAASWPGLALASATIIWAAGARLRVLGAALACVAFVLAAQKELTPYYSRPAFDAAARLVERESARTGGAIIDGTGPLSPGPLTGLDVVLSTRLPVVRAGVPAERTHPFTVFDPRVPAANAIAAAVSAAHGRPIYVVALINGATVAPALTTGFPPGYRLVARHVYPGFVPAVIVEVWSRRGNAAH